MAITNISGLAEMIGLLAFILGIYAGHRWTKWVWRRKYIHLENTHKKQLAQLTGKP